MGKPGRGLAVTLGVLAVLLSWLTAVPLAHEFNGLAPGDLPWAPDAWSAAYDGVYRAVGVPLGLSPYYFWGKPAFLLYAVALLLAWRLPVTPGRWSRAGLGLLRVVLVVGLVADVAGYWGGWGSPEMTPLTGYAFSYAEVWALLLLPVALLLLGVGHVRDRVRPRWSAWCLVAAGLLTLPFGFLVLGYAPHGVLLPVLVGLVLAVAADPCPGRAAGLECEASPVEEATHD